MREDTRPFFLLCVSVVLVAACSTTSTPTPTSGPTPAPTFTATPSKATPTLQVPPNPSDLAGGLLATFDVSRERFKVWVINPSTIDDILALQQGTSAANIPNGRILRGPGQGGHNFPWSWHLDPEDIEMAEFTIEVCDGRPSFVEENVNEFVDNVERYCPWSAALVEVEDFR